MRLIDTERIPIKLWLEDIDDGALQQARNIANLPFSFRHVAIMPDSHVGYGMPIGGVLATQGVIIPNAVGVDIGCGMAAVRTTLPAQEIQVSALKEIMSRVRAEIPLGFNHHKDDQSWDGFAVAPDLPIIQQELSSARRQLGTLGGGNHFIEIQRGSDDLMWLMLHSGSRNFGLKVAKHYHEIARKLCERWYSNIPEADLSFLPVESPEGKEYLAAMNYCLDFAAENRRLMMNRLMEAAYEITGAQGGQSINIHHNYAALENHFGKNVWVHRKGATLARVGQDCIIPGSMGTSSYICKGLGNPESFRSCSHGAGRRMGRKEAVRNLNLQEEQAKMAGVVHGLRNAEDLEEAPGAYKSIDEVMANQTDLVKIAVKLTPLAVIKA